MQQVLDLFFDAGPMLLFGIVASLVIIARALAKVTGSACAQR